MKKFKFIVSMLLIFLLSSCGVKVIGNIPNKDSTNSTKSNVNMDTNNVNITSIDIEGIKEKLGVLEKELAEDSGKDEILYHLNDFKEKSKLNTLDIFFGDELGNFYVNPAVELPSDYDHRTRPWYISAKDNGDYVAEPYVDYITNNKVLTIGKAIYKGKDFIGVVAIDLVVGNDDKNK